MSSSSAATRSSANSKIEHTRSSSYFSKHFYFNRLQRLWNSLPPVDLNLSISTIKRNLVGYLFFISLLHYQYMYLTFSVPMQSLLSFAIHNFFLNTLFILQLLTRLLGVPKLVSLFYFYFCSISFMFHLTLLPVSFAYFTDCKAIITITITKNMSV